jgi:hypothetical protein
MKRYRGWAIAGVTLVALIALVAWASAQTPMVARTSDMWSRGQVIGQTSVKRRAALQTAPDDSVFAIWQNMGGRLELAHIGTDGGILASHVLAIGAGESSDPQLQIGADGHLHLLWREGEYPNSTVHYIVLGTDGTPVSQPQTLSDPSVPVLDAPQLITDAGGRHHAIWADDAGVKWTMLSAEGTLLVGPTLVTTQGRFPTARVGDQGHLHLIWQWRQRAHVEAIFYVALDPENAGGVVDKPVEVARVTLRTGQGLSEPVIGLTQDMGHVFLIVRDFKYVASSGEYVIFPLESPQQSQIVPLRLRQGRYPEGLYSLEGSGTPLWVALSTSVADPEVADVVRSQITTIALKGDDIEEQVVTGSAQASLKPALTMDSNANLHMSWIESTEFGRYRVVYASTTPEVMQNYNALTLWDVLNVVFSNVFRLSTLIVALVAVLIMWAILPFLGLVVYHLVTSEETLDTVRSQGALVVALAFEVALTFIQPTRIGAESDWAAIRWAAPVTALIIAALVTLNFLRGRKYTHLFAGYFLFTAIDSVVQMLMYFLL